MRECACVRACGCACVREQIKPLNLKLLFAFVIPVVVQIRAKLLKSSANAKNN